MKASGRNVVVFYGSQTGTAEEFAGRLAKEAARYGMKALVADPEECEMVLVLYLNWKLVFITSNIYVISGRVIQIEWN